MRQTGERFLPVASGTPPSHVTKGSRITTNGQKPTRLFPVLVPDECSRRCPFPRGGWLRCESVESKSEVARVREQIGPLLSDPRRAAFSPDEQRQRKQIPDRDRKPNHELD